MSGELTQAQRYPWLTDDSRRLLDWLHEHPAAPRYNHHCGDRLSLAGLERVRQFEAEISTKVPGWQPGQPPAWLAGCLGGPGFAKLNLAPADWREPDGRARFIDACQPEVFTGDPLSFAELARLPVQHRPKALISTAMQLLPGLRLELEARFGCP